MSEPAAAVPRGDEPEPAAAVPPAAESEAQASPTRSRTFEVRTVAIAGDLVLAVPGLVNALQRLGIGARVLCPDEAAELGVLSLRKPVTEGPPPPALEPVRGQPDSKADLERLFKGVEAAAFLSPVGLNGRAWRPATHLDDLKLFVACAAEAHVARFAYLSTVASDAKSKVQCLREALEAEKLLEASRMEDFIFRAGPLMGRHDGLVEDAVRLAASASPIVWVWGYGDTPLQPLDPADLGACIGRSFVKQVEGFKPGIYTVAGSAQASWLELLDRALEKCGRFKLKFHVPLFVLKLAAVTGAGSSKTGTSFADRVRLLFEFFTTDRNDAQKLLGPQQTLRGYEQIQDELLARAT